MSVLKRKKPTESQLEIQRQFANKDPIALECSKCWRTVENLNPDTSSVICSYCVQGMVDPPEVRQKETGRPRGWQFRAKYRAPDGTLYSRGKVVDETAKSTKTGNDRVPVSKSKTTRVPKAKSNDTPARKNRGRGRTSKRNK